MYIGEQLGDYGDQTLAWAAQLGVEHAAAQTLRSTGIDNPDGTWNVEPIRRLIDRFASFGISLDVLALDLPSAYIARQRFPGIMMGTPSRDAEIEVIKQNVRAAAEAGISVPEVQPEHARRATDRARPRVVAARGTATSTSPSGPTTR